MSDINSPAGFHLMAKPTGAVCNLDCKYCFYLSKESLYPGSRFRMADTLLENYIKQLISAHRTPEVTIAWQGGEPTMMGLDFFKRSVAYAEKYKKPGQKIVHTLQTNGVLLDDDWAQFFKKHDFLIGVSVDGPKTLHDFYRVNKGGEGTFDAVIEGWSFLRKHSVEANILCTIHAANAGKPLEVYKFLRDELGTEFIQFIPIVEKTESGTDANDRSVKAKDYGNFLISIFDEWVQHDVGKVFVQMFDVALANWVGAPPGLCIFSETCGQALALEHNGDVYSCDHFVEPEYLLGNIRDQSLVQLVADKKQIKFGQDKLTTLPRYCLDCDVRFACHGGCPKDRFIKTPSGDPGLNYLCAGYMAFFKHVDQPLRKMVKLLREKKPPADIMKK